MSTSQLVGVTVFPEYLQSEGVDAVLDRLVQDAKVTAVATSPYVMEETDSDFGEREPPADAGAGSVRLLDRPLWGKRAVFVRAAPSFVPDLQLYHGLRYQPSSPTVLTHSAGHVIHDFIHAAHARKLKVYLQIQAAIPPGYRVQFGGPTDEDRPRLPCGSLPTKRLAKNGSLASPEILHYAHALIHDLLQVYPDIDGLRFDWPEYPPYFLDDLFLDFSEHAKVAAASYGFSYGRMQQAAADLYQKLHGGLTDADLDACSKPQVVDQFLQHHDGIAELLRFKATLVERMLAGFRQEIDNAGGKAVELMPNAFPPPWSRFSGMDFSAVASHCSGISVKQYTMHWPMILRFYGDQILQANPALSSPLLAQALESLLDIADDKAMSSVEGYRYPEPEEPHPIGLQAMAQKIEQAQQAAGDTPVYALAHAYGPVEDFSRRLQSAFQSSKHGLWVNRYAYLSNDKVRCIGDITQGG